MIDFIECPLLISCWMKSAVPCIAGNRIELVLYDILFGPFNYLHKAIYNLIIDETIELLHHLQVLEFIPTCMVSFESAFVIAFSSSSFTSFFCSPVFNACLLVSGHFHHGSLIAVTVTFLWPSFQWPNVSVMSTLDISQQDSIVDCNSLGKDAFVLLHVRIN